MKMTLVLVATLSIMGGHAFAASTDMLSVLSCHRMVSDEYRLKCYDSATEFGKKNEANAIAQNTGKWLVRKETSDIDDSQNVFMTISSNEKVLGPFSNGSAPAQILIRCMENTTSVVLIMNDHFLSDIQGYGAVTYRLDEKKAANKRLQVSTDNKALGLWNGGSAIPFSKSALRPFKPLGEGHAIQRKPRHREFRHYRS